MDREKLNSLNVFGIRDYARKVGVSSPTSKKKDELINEILDILEGKKQPQQSKTKQGRPPKNYTCNEIEERNVFSVPNITNSVTLCQPVSTINYMFKDAVSVVGYVELMPNGAGLLWQLKDFTSSAFYIPIEKIKTYKLKFGDRLVADIKLQDGQMIVDEILNINNVPISKYNSKRKDYNSISHQIPKKLIKFINEKYNNLNLMHGESFYFYGSNNNDNTIALLDMLKNADNVSKIYLNISIAEKNKVYLKNLNDIEMFFSLITDENIHAKTIINLAIERAKRLMECGNHVVLVVDDMLSISSVDDENLSMVKSIASLTKNANSSSISLFAVSTYNRLNFIEKLADKRLLIVDENIKIIE